jgi:hypothetical protein
MGYEIKRLVHLFLCLLFFLLFSVFGLLVDVFDSGLEFRNELNHVGHGKLVHSESPGILEDQVWSDVLVTCVKSGGEEFLFFSLDEEFEEVFDDLHVIGFSGGFDGVLVHFVLFGEGDGLFVLTVLSEQVG